MANTVSLLSYANTFGDWVVTTNALVRENNNLASNNYTKSTGTLYLSDPTLGLQVGNNAIVAGQLQVQGIGSSAYIQNNLRVDTQVYFQNTILGLTNSGELISYGRISASGPNIGLAVANNTTIGGYLRVSSNSTITGATVLQNTLAVTGAATLSNTLGVTGATTLNNTLAVTGATTMSSTLNVASNIVGSDNLTITNLSNTGTLIVRGGSSVVGTESIGGALSVSGSSYQNNITANSTIYTPILNATNYATVNSLTCNTIVRAATLNAVGRADVDVLVANSFILVPSMFVTTSLSAPYASVSANSITVGTGGLSVLGNFTINGTTVYNTPTFTLSAGTPNQDSYLKVYRTPGANAAFKWDNANVAWYVADVTSGANSYYYKVLSTQQLTDSTYTANSTLAASATSIFYLQGVANGTNTSISTNVTDLQNQISSNVTSLQNQISSNVALIAGVDATQNTNILALNGFAQSAYNKANTGSGTFNGTTGQSVAVNGIFTFASNNGMVMSGTANSMYFNTPQNLRTTDSPTFASLTLSSPLAFGQGGTNATTSAQALNNLLPTGTTSGYVLTTGGPGTFYWAAGGGGGGGGTTPGTTIASTRISYTANGSGIAYATPIYIPGASQLRVYIDGVRQFASEYVETSGNTAGVGIVSFTASPPSGSVILMEVDGYVINPYYANNIAYTINSTISPTANSIQLALDALASGVAFKSGTTFTSPVMTPTALVGVANTQVATTAFVNNLANSGITFAHNITGLASSASSVPASGLTGSTLASGVTASSLTSVGTISSGTWSGSFGAVSGANLTGLTAGNLSGTIPSGVLGNSTHYVGTTAITLNRSSASQTLTGVSIDGNAGGSAATFTSTSQNSQFNSLGVGTTASTTAGEIRATNNITAYYSSDKKFKENIEDIPNALDTVDAIGGKLFDWTDAYLEAHGGEDDYFNQKSDFGVVAQDVQSVFPRAVRTRPDGTLAVDYEKLVALSFAAIKELRAEIDTLKGSK